MGIAARLRYLHHPAVQRSIYVAAAILITLAVLSRVVAHYWARPAPPFSSTTHKAALVPVLGRLWVEYPPEVYDEDTDSLVIHVEEPTEHLDWAEFEFVKTNSMTFAPPSVEVSLRRGKKATVLMQPSKIERATRTRVLVRVRILPSPGGKAMTLWEDAGIFDIGVHPKPAFFGMSQATFENVTKFLSVLGASSAVAAFCARFWGGKGGQPPGDEPG